MTTPGVQGGLHEPGFEVDAEAAAADTQVRAGDVVSRDVHVSAAEGALLRCDEVIAGYVPGVNILNGCDLYVQDGELVGINTAALDRVDAGIAVPGISFAIPADVVHSVLEAILQDGEVIRGWMGALYTERGVIGAGGIPVRAVLVQDLYQNAPSLAAGMLPGDLIERFNGTLINSANQLNALEAATAPGSPVLINGRRAGVPIEFNLVLTKRPRLRS